MKTIEVGKKKYNVGFTFNSFRHMQDFDLTKLSEAQTKPFVVFGVLSDLFYGALNCSSKKYFPREDSDTILETYLEDNDVMETFNSLIDELFNSNFFKSLQAQEQSQE